MDNLRRKIEALREQYPYGSYVELIEMGADPRPLPSGSKGRLVAIDDMGTFHVSWEQGRRLGLIRGVDRFIVKAMQEMKIYIPLTGSMIREDCKVSGDGDIELSGDALLQYQPQIQAAMEQDRMQNDVDRGWMHWYGKSDELEKKVYSIKMNCENRENRLWGVAICQIIDPLTEQELIDLKEYISEQCSDGWGELFDQRPLETGDGKLYVHVWQWENWSVQTEQERFDKKEQKRQIKMAP